MLGADVTRLVRECELTTRKLSKIVVDTCLDFWGPAAAHREDVLFMRLHRDAQCIIDTVADGIGVNILHPMIAGEGELPNPETQGTYDKNDYVLLWVQVC